MRKSKTIESADAGDKRNCSGVGRKTKQLMIGLNSIYKGGSMNEIEGIYSKLILIRCSKNFKSLIGYEKKPD